MAIAAPVILAFLTEFPFYLLAGFEDAREAIACRWEKLGVATLTWATALLPYLVLTAGTGWFDIPRFAAWAALTGSVAFWFIRVDAGRAWSFALLVFLAGVILSGALRWIFPVVTSLSGPKIPLEILGHITLVRTAFWSVLLVGRQKVPSFGFVPSKTEAGIGALWFLVCGAIALPLGLWMGEIQRLGHRPNLASALPLFFGVLWVLALSEEFFFRALLQTWIARWLRNGALGLAIASALFGACHLGMHRTFPNWRYALLAVILGLACGAAFLQARSMRAGMVTHALAVTALKLFFKA